MKAQKGSFEIGAGESLGDSIRRVVCQQIEGAIAASYAKGKSKSSPVHQTRTHLKRARAALRLLAQDVPADCFKRANRSLRDVGRLISEVRDAEVRLATVEDMRDAFGVDRTSNFEETEELLAFELENFLAAFHGWEEEAARKLKRAQSGIARWPLEEVPAARICRSLGRSYRNGRLALEAVERRGSAPAFHELRKQAKTLWYQLRLLRPLEPTLFHALSRELKKLSDLLGHAHDLCFVAERLQGLRGSKRRQRGGMALEALLVVRERDLNRMALRIAQRFYVKKPKDFSAHLAQHFEDWAKSQSPASAKGRSIHLNVTSSSRG